MRNKDAFSGYHPTINFLYYALVLLFSMCLMHPVYLAISLTGALAYDIYLKGRKAVRFAVMGLLPMATLAALVNPAFNHEGQTILTYPWDLTRAISQAEQQSPQRHIWALLNNLAQGEYADKEESVAIAVNMTAQMAQLVGHSSGAMNDSRLFTDGCKISETPPLILYPHHRECPL